MTVRLSRMLLIRCVRLFCSCLGGALYLVRYSGYLVQWSPAEGVGGLSGASRYALPVKRSVVVGLPHKHFLFCVPFLDALSFLFFFPFL